MKNKHLSVIGLGYIGLPTAVLFAKAGIMVTGVDIKVDAVATINAGQLPFYEPALDSLLREVVHAKQLWATTHVVAADVFIIAVPTPFQANYVPDLSYVKAAIEAIAPVLAQGNLIILESTSPVGTTENLSHWIHELRPDLDCKDLLIAYCPERVLPGKILQELVHNDRVIGGLTQQAAEYARDFYGLFVKGNCVLTDARTAEMCKLTENAFRDVNIAFANELSTICDKLHINVWELIKLANLHPRVNILQPGPGVGGHCIAVDPWFIVDAAPRDVRLIRAAREVNDAQPSVIVDKVNTLAKAMSQPTIACLGLSYKANIDDVRESPAVEVVLRLAREAHYRLLAVEPHIHTLPKALLSCKRVALFSLSDALQLADIVIFLVDHDIFKTIAPAQIKQKKIVDTRGVLATILSDQEACHA